MVSVKNLDFGYSKHLLFRDLSLQLNKGHIYGLLGKNGAGKSTLLKNMTGLVYPKAGSCTINGINVSGRPVSALIGTYFLPEEIYVPALTAEQYAQRTGIFYPKFNVREFTARLKALDVDSTTLLSKLSYGQQKKAMIAFGLATNTSLLIMDEPTNGLDIPSKVQFRKLIASVLTEDRCILISTHQVRDLDSLIDTLVVLHNSRIVTNCSIEIVPEKMIFRSVKDSAGMPVLYEEEGILDKKVILRNQTMESSKTDLELLFNAITSNNEKIIDLLNN